MFSFIKRLQQKSEPQRRAIALWTALAVTLCIFLLWLIVLFARLDDVADATSSRENQVSPFQSLSELVASFSTIFKEQF